MILKQHANQAAMLENQLEKNITHNLYQILNES